MAEYYRVLELVDRLGHAGNEAARRYLNGRISSDSAARWLETYSLMSRNRARQLVRFIEQYRSYVINYNLGEDLVAQDVAAQAGNSRERGREVFGDLLSSPHLPSALQEDARVP